MIPALCVAGLNALAALVGAVEWWRGQMGRPFWPLLRVGQVAAIAYAIYAGIAAATGRDPSDTLFWLYALLPLAVALIAEQVRLASAQTVLDARDLEDAQAVGRLPEGEQRAIVLAIVRREMVVMTCAAAVVVFLALRAAQTSSGL